MNEIKRVGNDDEFLGVQNLKANGRPMNKNDLDTVLILIARSKPVCAVV